MSKKAQKSNSYSAPNLQEKPSDFSNTIITIIISFYLLIECVPKIEVQDQMCNHWLLLSILNGCALIYIINSKNLILNNQLRSLAKNSIPILYLSFFIIAGLSIIVATNQIESLIVYNRLFTSILAFSVISILLSNRLYLLKNIALVISIIVLFQGFETVALFYKELGIKPIDVLINDLQGTTGNKNIFAAAFVIKTPFIVYCIFTRTGFLKSIAVLALTLGFFSVFLINARAAFLGLILEMIILMGAIAYIYWKENQLKKYWITSSLIVASFILSFFIADRSLSKATANLSSTYGTVASRLGSLSEQTTAESNVRIAYWKSSIELIKKNPFIGVGYGNWKLYTPLYTNTLVDDNVFSKHPHNDFLEVAGETGVINALIFLSIFIAALILTFKTLLSKQSFESKMIPVFAFTAVCGYFVDAMFNFPGERPNIQILFALALAILVVNWLSGKTFLTTHTNQKLIKQFCLVAILLSVGSIYVNAMVFKSSRAQYKVDNDLANIDGIDTAMPKLKYEEVNLMFPAIPNIGENSETIGFKKAKYLQKEKRYDEAIQLLDSVQHQTPNLPYGAYLKCNIYLAQKKLDSAYKYGKIAAYAKPRHFYYYRMASYLAMEHKDVKEVYQLFKRYNTYRKDQQSYSYFAQSLFYAGADKREVKKIIEEGLKLYPDDKIMFELKAYIP